MAFVGARGVDLKRRGAEWLGLCPLHAEKTPSFSVSPTRGTYKCYGCQAQGDVFGFLMAADGLRFPDAVAAVAAEVGVELQQSTSGGGGRRVPPQTATAPGRTRAASVHSAADEGATVRPIGDARGAKIVATYDYTDRRGALIYQVCRMEPKTFRQRRPDPRREGAWVWKLKADRSSGLREQPTILYRIPELAAAILAEDPIWVVEGERDVEALRQAMQVATTNSGGAGAWRHELAAPFSGYRGQVRIVQDRDEPGEKHARDVYESLAKVMPEGAPLMIVEAAVGKDAADHLGAGRSVEEFVQVWPLPDDLLETDPKRFKRIMLRKALESPATVLDYTTHGAYKTVRNPLFVAGLANLPDPVNWQGCVVVSGGPSTGKTYLAIATLIDNALAGWDCWYFSCEMSQKTIRERGARAVASREITGSAWMQGTTEVARAIQAASHVDLPERFNIVDVGIGVTIEDVIEFLSEKVTERPTLVCLDSVSSFIDNMTADRSDAFGMAQLREVTRWVTSLAKLSHGQVSFLILSELNKEGRAKGRSLDHRSDCAISMTQASDEDSQEHVKAIRCSKNWHGPIGRLGTFALWHQLGRLQRIDEGPK